MQKNRYYLILLLSVAILFNQLFLSAKAIEEMELKLPGWMNTQETVKLQGMIREDITSVKPQTGIGVIGLRFVHQSGYPSYIEYVYGDSPASRAGIRAKDLIFAVDGIRTDYLNSEGVYQLLSGAPGSKVRIFITRGQSMFNVELVREDLVNFSPDIQNRYLSGPIAVPFNVKDLFQFH